MTYLSVHLSRNIYLVLFCIATVMLRLGLALRVGVMLCTSWLMVDAGVCGQGAYVESYAMVF